MSKELKEKRKQEADFLRQSIQVLKNEINNNEELKKQENNLLFATIKNVEAGLEKFEGIDDLPFSEQARIYADVSFLMNMIEGSQEDEECGDHDHGSCCHH